ncbi:hypothetical protein ACQ86G_26035 [Roseateles chitinivorans]|uniref:hypothetical protein n=1 Tax=Roseateles chitinivorans TaxID=2917965 RepID=UPI003D674FC1
MTMNTTTTTILPLPGLTMSRVLESRLRRDETRGALIAPSADLGAPALLETAGPGLWYRPDFRASPTGGDGGAPDLSLGADGTLTLWVDIGVPAALAGRTGSARAWLGEPDGLRCQLLMPACDPVTLARERQGDRLRLTATLAGATLERARVVLFDAEPSAVVRFQQDVTLAAPQTREFFERYWSEALQGDLRLLMNAAGSAGDFVLLMTQQAPDFPSQYTRCACQWTQDLRLPSLPGYLPWKVDWQGTAVSYYQHNRDHGRVLYLPDHFELAAGATGRPAASLLEFRGDGGASDGGASDGAVFRFFGRPVVERDRIEAAARTLAAQLGHPVTMSSAQDWRGSGLSDGVRATFTLLLPPERGQVDGPPVSAAQSDAIVDLADGVTDTLMLSVPRFLAVWAAIFSSAPELTLFKGWVDVSFNGGRFVERLAFDGRLPASVREAYLDELLASATDRDPREPIAVEALSDVFQGSPRARAIRVSFDLAEPVALDADRPRATAWLRHPVRALLLGQADAGPRACRIDVDLDAGGTAASTRRLAAGETALWLRRDDLFNPGQDGPQPGSPA